VTRFESGVAWYRQQGFMNGKSWMLKLNNRFTFIALTADRW